MFMYMYMHMHMIMYVKFVQNLWLREREREKGLHNDSITNGLLRYGT